MEKCKRSVTSGHNSLAASWPTSDASGMDSLRVIARFEAERQALAMMDHPNIAKVLDAGTTK